MSACGNQKAAFAAQRRSVHHKVDLWYRVRLAPHLSRPILQLAVFEHNPQPNIRHYGKREPTNLNYNPRFLKENRRVNLPINPRLRARSYERNGLIEAYQFTAMVISKMMNNATTAKAMVATEATPTPNPTAVDCTALPNAPCWLTGNGTGC